MGSTRTDRDSLVDLMGDESATAAQPAQSAASAQNTQDLLADIFGSNPAPTTSAASQAAPAKSSVTDIMGLFGNESTPAPASQQVQQSASSALDMLSAMSSSSAPKAAPPASAPAPSRPQLQAYTAYEKNGLKITLTPKASPAQPGMVQILVKFVTTEDVPVENVNFQAAVPKVSNRASG